ncbi:MAG: type IV secretion system DNA-binding domain-containing protein [Acidobacteriaceae bacterium]|nr:type IV secretion system DNA-binding domain-containing protein [Acidobacteriaceae bacterium]
MAFQWGRRERIYFPPRAPIYKLTAFLLTALMAAVFVFLQINVVMTVMQRSYWTDYIRSGIGAYLKMHGDYRLIYIAGGKNKPRLALPSDLVNQSTELSALAQSKGYTTVLRGPSIRYEDGSLHRWMGTLYFDGAGIFGMFRFSILATLLTLAGLLAWAIPADIKREKLLKYGRLLSGPEELTPRLFNRKVKGDGLGFKAIGMRGLLRIPREKEAHHIQIAGDTGTGKSTLIVQVLRQVRDRGDSAIVYDPGCFFVQQFYNERRGDIILNPLDVRCPYWGPAEEMKRNSDAVTIATSLYQPDNSGKDEFFYRTPRKIFAHMLKSGPTPHQLAEWMADEAVIDELVARTEMEQFVSQKAGPQRAGVLSSLSMVADCLRLLPLKDSTPKSWNATDWAEERPGWIFITSHPRQRELLRPLQSLWIDLLILNLMSVPEQHQKKVWFVIDELASLQKLPQFHTAITESRKSRNPLLIGFQGKSQLETLYGHLAEAILSQAGTKIFMKTGEPKAALWIADTIGKVEVERLRETKFDGTRSSKNFMLEQVPPRHLVTESQIEGLPDKHAYMKFGNYVTRFAFDYYPPLPTTVEGFIERKWEGNELSFDRKTLEPIRPVKPAKQAETQPETPKPEPEPETPPEATGSESVPEPKPDDSGQPKDTGTEDASADNAAEQQNNDVANAAQQNPPEVLY